MHAAGFSNENVATINLLLEAGGDPNAQEKNGFNPCTPRPLGATPDSGTFAANTRIIIPGRARYLLENGNHWQLQRESGDSLRTEYAKSLHGGAESKSPKDIFPNMEFAGNAIYGEQPPDSIMTGMEPQKNTDMMTALLKAGADPKARDKNGFTPLHLAAAINQNPAAIPTLLKAGADPKARDKNGNTFIHSSMWNNCPDVIAVLLKAGIDPNTNDKYGNSFLHLAAARNANPLVIAILIDAGAETNARNKNGNSPLHFAAKFNKFPRSLTRY